MVQCSTSLHGSLPCYRFPLSPTRPNLRLTGNPVAHMVIIAPFSTEPYIRFVAMARSTPALCGPRIPSLA